MKRETILINSFEVGYDIKCPNCGKDAVECLFDIKLKRIRFRCFDPWVNDPVEIKETVVDEKQNFEIRCPYCGEWSLSYVGVPADWEVC